MRPERWFYTILLRLRSLFRRQKLDQELDEELRHHMDRKTEQYVAQGLEPAEARRRAMLEMDGIERSKEECRDVRPLRWLDDLVREVRLGFRGRRRDRLFSASVITILALGIGASVAMFSVLNAVVLRPLPYARLGELARLTTHLIVQNLPDGTSMANFLDWQEQSHSFAAMTFYRRTIVSVVTFAGIDAPQRAQEGLVGPEFFEVLGTPPLVGRTFARSAGHRANRRGTDAPRWGRALRAELHPCTG